MRQDTNYAYAVARIKVLETRLLKSSDIDALIESTPEALVSALSGAGYPAVSAASSDAGAEFDLLSEYTSVLSDHFAETVRAVMKFAPEPEVLEFFLLPADFSNLKLCIKKYGRRYNEDGQEESIKLSPNGTVPPETMADAFSRSAPDSLGPLLSRAAKEASDELAKSMNSRKSDIIIDRYCFQALQQAAGSGCFSTRRVLGKYLMIYADWKNLLAAMRIRASGSDVGLMEKAYLRGNIGQEHFSAVARAKTVPFAGTQYEPFIGSVISRAGENAAEKGGISFYEQLSQAYIDGQLMKDRNEPYKVNALLSYIACRRREISLIRLIIVGKRSGLSAARIRDLVEENSLPFRYFEGV